MSSSPGFEIAISVILAESVALAVVVELAEAVVAVALACSGAGKSTW